MKKLLIVLGGVAFALFVVDQLATSWIKGQMDEAALDMDAQVALRDVCDGRPKCLAAVERYGEACEAASGPTVVDVETFFEQVANTIRCVNERSGTRPFPTD